LSTPQTFTEPKRQHSPENFINKSLAPQRSLGAKLMTSATQPSAANDNRRIEYNAEELLKAEFPPAQMGG
jgi:hypothetical protein